MIRSFRYFLCFTGMFFYLNGYAEKPDTLRSYTLYNIGIVSSLASNGLTPFGMVGNRYGKMPLKANNGYLQTSAHYRQWFVNGLRWDAKINLLASTSRYRKIYVQEIYAEASYKDRFNLSIGSREGEYDIHSFMDKAYHKHVGSPEGGESYNQSLLNARLSSGDLALSSNARPVPEINFYTPRFLTIPRTGGWLQAKGNFAVGRSFDTDYLESFAKTSQNYTRNILWHHKSVYLQIKNMHSHFPFSFTAGVRHFAQWGGTSTDPKLAEQPQSFKDFLRIIVGKSGDSKASSSDQINVLGNHYGTYDLRLGYDAKDWSAFVYYQHFFDDRSGMEWYNKWDGLKGVEVYFPKLLWMSRVVIEHLSTMNQSGPFHFIEFDHNKYSGYGGGSDNYYNNGEYTTGASYFNRSLGSPLLISPEYNDDGSLGFKQNRIRAWHVGIEGQVFKNLNYRMKVSSAESFGTPYAPTLHKLSLFTLLLDLRYSVYSNCRYNPQYLGFSDWDFGLAVGLDRGSLLGKHFGVSLSITKRGIF